MATESRELDIIVAELAQLKRQHKRLKGIVYLLLGLVIAVLVLGQSQRRPVGTTIEVRELGVVDSQGKRIATLGSDEAGLPQLVFLDREGRARLSLAFDWWNSCPVLAILDTTGDKQISLAGSLPGYASLRLGRTYLSEGQVVLFDHGGRQRVFIGSESSGNNEDDRSSWGFWIRGMYAKPSVEDTATFADRLAVLAATLERISASTRVALVHSPDGPSLSLRDENGYSRAVLGSVALVSHDRMGTETKRPPSSLVFFDREGYVIRKYPE